MRIYVVTVRTALGTYTLKISAVTLLAAEEKALEWVKANDRSGSTGTIESTIPMGK